MARARSSRENRIDVQPAFVLHQHPYRETSRLLDVFSRDHGRLTIVARGVQRPGSQLRAVLTGFQPVLLSWFGNGEVKTLHAAEWQGGVPQLAGLPLMCGFYLNELLLNLLPRHQPHQPLFAAYFDAIRSLAHGVAPDLILRRFEWCLLCELGFAPDLSRTGAGEPVLPEATYAFDAELGIVPVDGGVSGVQMMSIGEHADAVALQALRPLLRQLIGAALGDTVLFTRRLLQDVHRL
ncbi:DNA repair protein RecO [Chitinibacteraceae bacterium HSL-7]